MIDVHPPHASVHTWRDFFIHIATIVVGLCIAVGLEQSLEFFHNRHALHVAEANLRIEIRDNQQSLGIDEKQLATTEARLQQNIAVLTAHRSDSKSPVHINSGWYWNGMESSAWDTARNSGALGLMPFTIEQHYASIYGQQNIINQQSSIYLRDIYYAFGSQTGHDASSLQPDEVDRMVVASRQAITDLHLLLDLCHNLDLIYTSYNNTKEES